MSVSDFLCSGQQMLRSVWRHYNQSTGGLHCKTVTMEMIDSGRHFKASPQPHKPQLDLSTTVPPRTKTQILVRENGYGFTYSICSSAFMGLMFSVMNQFHSVNTHAALLLCLPLRYTNIHRYPHHTHPEASFLQTKQYELSACGRRKRRLKT